METEEIGSFVIIAYLAMFGLATVVFIFHIYYSSHIHKMERDKQRIAFRSAVEAEERQKEKIARNLHDEAITIFTVSGRHIEEYISSFENKDTIPKSLITAKELIDQGIDGIRNISLDLIPSTFINFGLIKALELYVSQLNISDESDTELANKANFDTIPFSKNEQLNIYRICLELLSNLYKHARYSYLRVTINQTDKALIVNFEHDGKGVNNDEIKTLRRSSKGLGLHSLESRLLILNARVDYQVGTDTSRIHLSIPFTL